MKKLFTLFAAFAVSACLWATDLTTLNYAGGTELPSGYKYYGSSTGTENKSAFSIIQLTVGDATLNVFDVTAGGSGAYNKRAIEFTLTENASVTVKLYTGNAGRTFSMYQGSSTAVKSVTLEAKNTEYEFTYDFTGATTAEPQTFSFSGSGSKVYIASITFTAGAPSTAPVSAVTISGPETSYVGGSATLTAKASGATEFWWTAKGSDTKLSETNTYKFTPTAAGEYTFVAYAQNQYNNTPVSAEHKITVAAKLCGELIKATHTGSKTASVEGVVGGSVDKNTQSDGKLGGTDQYFGVKLADGTFKPGDEVTIYASTPSATVQIFSDKGVTMLNEGTFDNNNIYTCTLDKATEWIYLYRTETAGSAMNPTLGYISVSRACEASSNADIKAVYALPGEEKQYFTQDADTFFIIVPVEVGGLSSAPVYVELVHPLATATPASPFNMNIPAVGAAPAEQIVTVTAEDGTTKKNYTIRVIRRAAASTDATLKSLAVTGYTLTPEFASDILEYTIVKPYGSNNPGTDKLVVEKSDNAADTSKDAVGNDLIITVTAEDGEHKLTYTIHIVEGEAPKKALEIIMTNGYSAYIPEGDAGNIYAYYLAGEAEPTVQSYKVNEGTTWEQNGKVITLTGADQSTAQLMLNIAAVDPVVYTADKITFDGSETWIKGGYGWDATKKWKFSKTDDDYSREIAGKTHVEFFMPACDTVVLYEGAAQKRDIRIYVNGTEVGEKTTLPKNGELAVAVNQAAAFMLTVASAQTGGDGGIGGIRMAKKGEQPTDIRYAAIEGNTVKFMRNGQLFILRDGVLYNAQGARVE